MNVKNIALMLKDNNAEMEALDIFVKLIRSNMMLLVPPHKHQNVIDTGKAKTVLSGPQDAYKNH